VILREQAERFAGQCVREASGNSRLDLARMQDQRLRDVRSWGKHFLLCFDGFTLRVHFLLWGSYRIDERRDSAPRLHLRFEDGELNFYSSSLKYLEGPLEPQYDWAADVMSPAWDPRAARARLRRHPQVLACDALLDQDVFAGVGNIIKNEVLWRIRVHPESTIGALSPRKLGDLVREARTYSFDFYAWKKAFVLKKHYQVHTRTLCPRDGNRLSFRAHLGTRQRRAFFCERCQKLYR